MAGFYSALRRDYHPVTVADFCTADLIDAGRIAARRIGGPLLFGRLWQRLGIDAVLEEVLQGRQFGFAVERAVFVATLHRLFVSYQGSLT